MTLLLARLCMAISIAAIGSGLGTHAHVVTMLQRMDLPELMAQRLGRSLLDAGSYVYDYETEYITPPSLEECSSNLTSLAATWAESKYDTEFDGDVYNLFNDGFSSFFLEFVQSTGCYNSSTPSTINQTVIPFSIYMDLTWGVALANQHLQYFIFGHPQYTPNSTIFSYFTSLADLQAEPPTTSIGLTLYFVMDYEAQYNNYQGVLESSIFGKDSIWEQDNAPVLQNATGLLFPRTYLMLFYRQDIFDAYGLSPPDTWDELIATAQALQGRSFPNITDGGTYGICMDLRERCKSNFYLMAIAASLIQSQGLAQGVWMDPESLTPLVNNSAMIEALRVFSALKALAQPGANESCMAWNPTFDEGRCAMMIEWDVNMHFMMRPKSQARGNLNVSLLPGSTVVLDRRSGNLVPCNATLCPFATAAAAQKPIPSPTTRRSMAEAPASLVNRAPYSTFSTFDTTYSALGPEWDPAVSNDITYYLYSYNAPFPFFLRSRQTVMNDALGTVSGGGAPQWSSAPPPFNLTSQLGRGFDEDDLRGFYQTYWKARWHPNPATDIATEGAELYRIAVEEAIHNATTLGQAPAQVVAALASRFPMILQYVNYSSDYEYATLYRRSLGIATDVSVPGPPEPPGPPPAAPAGSDHNVLIVATVVPVVALLLALAALLGVLTCRRQQHQTVMGKVMAPAWNPDTTLLCTDIQNSVVLWATLEAGVMDAAVSLHHECLRKCMLKRAGYLSAMEGDSFIIAFHDGRSAIFFAMDAQLALLKCDWSPELLARPECQPVWTSRRAAANLERSSPSSRTNSMRPTRSALGEMSRSLVRPLMSMRSLNKSKADMAADTPLMEWSRALGLRRAIYGNGLRDIGSGSEARLQRAGFSDEIAADEQGDGADARACEGAAPPSPLLPQPSPPSGSGLTGALRSLTKHVSLTRRANSVTSQDTTSPQVEFGIVQRTGSALSFNPSQRGIVQQNSSSGGVPPRVPVIRRKNSTNDNPLLQPMRSVNITNITNDPLARMSSSELSFPPPPIRTSAKHSCPARRNSACGLPASRRSSSGAACPTGRRMSTSGTGMHTPHFPASGNNSPSLLVTQTSPHLSHFGSAVPAALDCSAIALDLLAAEAHGDSYGVPDVAVGGGSGVEGGAGADKPASVALTWHDIMVDGIDVELGRAAADGRRGQVLVFNGLRVRMGLYSGIASADDIVHNQSAGSVQYSGESLEAVKAVCNAAGGGMVLLPVETYRRVLPQRVQQSALLLYAGDYHLDDSRRHWVLYQAAPVALPQRMPLLEPIQSLTIMQLGTQVAPVGVVTIVFMYVVGASTLLADIPEETRPALARFHTVVTQELLRWGGYLVEAVDGLILTAFNNSASAASWGLACHEQMLRQDWSPELLAHEYCEEVFVVQTNLPSPAPPPLLPPLPPAAGVPQPATSTGGSESGKVPLAQLTAAMRSEEGLGSVGSTQCHEAQAPKRRRVLMRGLRLKVGLDVGRPTPDINAGSGRMQYRGRVMNRSARIASKASAGHVVCSTAALRDMIDTPSPMPAAISVGPLLAESLGVFNLKGIVEPQELFDIHHGEPEGTLQGAPFSGTLWMVKEQAVEVGIVMAGHDASHDLGASHGPGA